MRIKALILWIVLGYHLNSCNAQRNSFDDKSFILLEMFTSQGCSSCASADALISEVIENAEKRNSNVFVLTYHVDYWDYLGWKDKLAKPAFAARQRKYAKVLGSLNIYTPQLVVNGELHFVGSDRRKLFEIIGGNGIKTTTVEVNLEVAQKGNTLDLLIRLAGDFQNSIIHLAIVEKGLTTEIKGGENKGRTINYDNVVRIFQSRESDKEVFEKLNIPADINSQNAELIVFVQDKNSWEVKGVSKLKLEEK
ncbi:MAG: DUF1223 domain-containing protein [Flammeovirgaceae bacterium]|nr:DUF1223 domain-containing protein [Flammeovirgaceae bacterium]